MNNLKSTIEELEGGIETYQAYAEEKSQQLDEKNSEIE